ncbi:MAG: HAMP domain-containing sensor histidine kinase, partial [Clostridiaceae bacterium]
MMEKLKGYRSKFEELKDKNTAFFQKFYTEEILLAFLIVFVTIILLSGGYFNSFFTFIFFWVFVAYFIVTIWSVRKTLLINSVLIRRPETWVLAIVSVLLILMLYPLGYSRFQWIFYLIFIGANLETAIFYDQKKSMNERFLEHKDPKYESVRNDTRQILHEMKDTEGKLEREVNDRLKAERLRSELITNISHDIRTPLTSIINFTKLLSNEETTAVGKDYLGVIDKSAQRMKVMVEDLFEATKSSTGNIEVEMGNIDFSEILMQVYAPLHNSFTDKNIELVYNRVD